VFVEPFDRKSGQTRSVKGPQHDPLAIATEGQRNNPSKQVGNQQTSHKHQTLAPNESEQPRQHNATYRQQAPIIRKQRCYKQTSKQVQIRANKQRKLGAWAKWENKSRSATDHALQLGGSEAGHNLAAVRAHG